MISHNYAKSTAKLVFLFDKLMILHIIFNLTTAKIELLHILTTFISFPWALYRYN